MNAKTAEHLNFLRANARPVVLNDKNVPTGGVLVDYNSRSEIAIALYRKLASILDAAVSDVTAVEIREAAAERREANVLNVEFSPHNWTPHYAGKGIPWTFTARLWAACRPQLLAAIEGDNAARLAAYEAYRVACEQGVAVPPMAPTAPAK